MNCAEYLYIILLFFKYATIIHFLFIFVCIVSFIIIGYRLLLLFCCDFVFKLHFLIHISYTYAHLKHTQHVQEKQYHCQITYYSINGKFFETDFSLARSQVERDNKFQLRRDLRFCFLSYNAF